MWKHVLVVPAMLICSQVPVLADVIVPGTEIQVRLEQRVDVSNWDRGRIYPAHVARDVYAKDGDMVIPRGAEAELIVRKVGPDQFVLDLESITARGQRYAMDASGPQYHMPDNDRNQGSGIIGAITGAIAGANGERVEPRGAEIRIPPGSVITFHLEQPLRLVNWNDPGYSRGPNHYHRDPDWYR
jgi:hypothetical protein